MIHRCGLCHPWKSTGITEKRKTGVLLPCAASCHQDGMGKGKHQCGCHGRLVKKEKMLEGCGDDGGVALVGVVGSVLERFLVLEHAAAKRSAVAW